MKQLFILAFSLFLFAGQSSAQLLRQAEPGFAPSEVLVKFEKGTDLSEFFLKMNRNYPSADFFLKKNTIPDWGIYVLGFENHELSEQEVVELLRQDPAIAKVQLNQKVQYREVFPDDTNWSQQWSMNLMNAPDAWELTTGGITAQGDTIVVAVLEKGYEPTHTELTPNLWVNRAEIPNNFIDDDNNGYTDDYVGYDVANDTDGEGTGSRHGTSVMGIVGAKGDNGQGIAGVNWDVKIMPIVNVGFLDEIVAGHYYVLESRRLYNATNGAQGAFVVALNASFGFDTTFPSAGPLYGEWCDLIDSLGQAGVLTVGATTNADANVDIVGDMPTTCPSEYQIAVTSITQLDLKPTGAGYGLTHIDLGAPGGGGGAHTTDNNNSYRNFPGTSAAAPHVSGSIALLYSLPCENIAKNAITEPAKTARTVRDLIFNNVTPNFSLKDLSTTGGRIDIGASMKNAEDIFCEGTRSTELLMTRINNQANPVGADNTIRYEYQVPNYDFTTEIYVYAANGQLMLKEDLNPEAFQVNTFEINPYYWASGKYFVMLFQGREFITDNFVKF